MKIELKRENDDTEANLHKEDVDEDKAKKEVWFDKVKLMVDHVRDVSIYLIWLLGTCMSIDKMMIRFMGRSK